MIQSIKRTGKIISGGEFRLGNFCYSYFHRVQFHLLECKYHWFDI